VGFFLVYSVEAGRSRWRASHPRTGLTAFAFHCPSHHIQLRTFVIKGVVALFILFTLDEDSILFLSEKACNRLKVVTFIPPLLFSLILYQGTG
jgi:hypothetical protein